MRIVSEETRAKISESLKGRHVGGGILGSKRTEETKSRIRKARQLVILSGRGTRKGQKNAPQTIEKIRLAMLGHSVSIETRAKLRVAHIGKHLTEETKRKIAASEKGRIHSKEAREKIRLKSLAQWSNSESRTKILSAIRAASKSPSRRLKLSKAMKGRVPPKTTIEAMKEANRARRGEKRTSYKIKDKELYRQRYYEMWRQDSYVANQMKARNIKPNKSELKLQGLLDKHFPNKWGFVGDGQLIIGGKCPDFANMNGRKSLIELFGLYWHKDENPQGRIDHYSNYGYTCMVIWEDELNGEEQLIQKIGDFENG